MGKKALFLGPGGPFGAVEIGALRAFHENGKQFDIIAGNSIGSAIALTYASPSKRYAGDRIKALAALRTYTSLELPMVRLTKRNMPFNYRIWHKTWGELNDLYEGIMEHWLADSVLDGFDQLPKLWQDFYGFLAAFSTPLNLRWGYTRSFWEIYNDLPAEDQNPIGAWISMVTACIPKAQSTGFVVPLHGGMRTLIDFDNLKSVPQEIYIGALNLRDRHPELFSKDVITPAHLQASTTVIFMNEICRIGDLPYAESTYVDAYNFKEVLEMHPDIDTIVLIDILGMKSWVYEPQDLVDAFNVSITGGFANSARDDLAIFEERYLNKRDETGRYRYHDGEINYVKVQYEIPPDIRPTWTEDVMNRLEAIGYEAATDCLNRI